MSFQVKTDHWANGSTYQCVLCPEVTFPEVRILDKYSSLYFKKVSEMVGKRMAVVLEVSVY